MATALPLPNLDDRRWADLVDEGRALIPFYAPEWTDHNVHDPGIMLIELFAWLAEMDLFTVNQITDAHRRKFLALAGIELEPIRAADALLHLELAPPPPLPAPQPSPLVLAAGTEFEGRDPFTTPVRFRARHDLTVASGKVAALLTNDGANVRNLTSAWKRGEPIQPFGSDPGPGSAFWIGFDTPESWPIGEPVSLGFAVAQAGGKLSRTERDRIVAETDAAALDCVPLNTPCASDTSAVDEQSPTDEAAFDLAHHSVRLIWEVLTGPDRWTRLASGDEVQDGTRALTLSGRVVIAPPEALMLSNLDGRADVLRWLRVRIGRGRHDAAPVLQGVAFNAIEVIQAVPAVSHMRIAPGAVVSGVPPAPGTLIDLDLSVDSRGQIARLNFAAASDAGPAVRLLNYDAAAGTISFDAAALAYGTGEPSQSVSMSDAPVMVESLRLISRESTGWRAWATQSDFDASTRTDAHVTVDAEAGIATAGDGEHGRAVPFDALIVAFGDVTRAERGNLATGAIDRLADSPRNRAVVDDLASVQARLSRVTNVIPATGGSPAETLPAAIARAQDERERPRRAVTLDDHVALALETPGVRIARAEARANFHPGFPCLTAPGIVTLLILPELPTDRPEPTAGLLQRVVAYLNRRRVIGTRLEVAGPVYVPVTVRATVEALPGTRRVELQADIGEALDRFFHPLTGGAAGGGWPFGRDVYRSEVLQVIDQVPDVMHVISLELIGECGCPTCGNLCLGPIGLVDARPHQIDVK
ncbi:MAG: putative baseplate assembly protein [Chloroflexota bacterium]|nr:putative baseplate assembly protein [Chloroflexota bacterium]